MLEQTVGVVPVAAFGRHAARRRVRVRKQAEGLELGEDIADRGRRERQPGTFDEVLRADRLTRRHVALDDPPQQFFLAFGELDDRPIHGVTQEF